MIKDENARKQAVHILENVGVEKIYPESFRGIRIYSVFSSFVLLVLAYESRNHFR